MRLRHLDTFPLLFESGAAFWVFFFFLVPFAGKSKRGLEEAGGAGGEHLGRLASWVALRL